MKKKLKVGSIQKKKDGTKVFVATAYELKNLKTVMDSQEVKDLLVSNDPSTKKYFNMETKAEQLINIETSLAAGRLTEEKAEKMRENVNRIPAYVICDISTSITVPDSF